MSIKILRNAAGHILRRRGELIGTTVNLGDLYNWYAATDARNICSVGWRLPLRTEVNTMRLYAGGSASGGKFKETGLTHWLTPNEGATNEYGFNARGAGLRSSTGVYSDLNIRCNFWAIDGTSGFRFGFINSTNDFIQAVGVSKLQGQSIRPVKNTTTLTHGQTGTYTDPSGITYPTIAIGSPAQEWVACNIMTKHYRDGSPIPEETDNANWAAATTGLRCSFDNVEANAGVTTYGVGKILCREYVDYTVVKYGLLYNWFAATDVRNICSVGWHIPTKAEFQTLQDYLGGASVAGGKLKGVGLTYFNPNVGATNSSLFNARGSGQRSQLGDFQNLQNNCIILSVTSLYSVLSTVLYLYSSGENSLIADGSQYKKGGACIRPIKDSTTLTHGQTGTYTDPSGFVYPTICIGTQEIVAINIKTQHYRNGDPIPEVTDNTAWAGLVSGAWCAYNNDHSNV